MIAMNADARSIGVNVPGEIVDLASTAGLFEKSGAFYSYKGERIAQGREKACAFVAEHPEITQEVRLTLVEARKAENAALGVQLPVVQAA
jgi:recombination protein RecA